MSWSELSEWWPSEVADDPAYEEVVIPLLLELLQLGESLRYLDVGCGEGRVMRAVEERGATVVGLDLSARWIEEAGGGVVADVHRIPMRDGSFDGVYSVLTLEHVADHAAFFAEAARATRPGGVLAIVINRPSWTAPGSTPISDSDGEVLWRPGDYFSNGTSEIRAGEGTVVFHHGSMAALLNAAAGSGWRLELMEEQPHHEFEDQPRILRLLACRWRRM